MTTSIKTMAAVVALGLGMSGLSLYAQTAPVNRAVPNPPNVAHGVTNNPNVAHGVTNNPNPGPGANSNLPYGANTNLPHGVSNQQFSAGK